MPQTRAGLPMPLVIALLAVCVACAILVLQWDNVVQLFGDSCSEYLGEYLSAKRCGSAVNKIHIYAIAFALLPLIMIAERLIPADPEQPQFSPGLLVDLLWFATFPLLIILLRTPIEEGLKAVFGEGTHLLADLPVVAQFLIVILASDFIAWASHWVRHRVPMFWEFHKIHHSQTQLNYFTSLRLHPGDQVINTLIRFLPFTLLGLEIGLPAFLVWSTILRIYEMFVHSNIKTNLGWLRYIIVTPQSHRIHHSEREEHVGMNLGNFFSIWDFLFRTQCLDFKVYPKTHCGDPECPPGTASTVSGGIRMLVSEMIYPFRVLGRRWRAGLKSN